MENLYWAISLWALLFVLVPFSRIKELWPAALVGLVTSFIINYLLVQSGYVQFTKYISLWGGVPPFHVIGVAAAGIMAVNWLKPGLTNKIVIVLVTSMLMLAAKFLLVKAGAYQILDGYNYYWAFAKNMAGISLHLWLSILLLGKEKLYGGNRNRFSLKSVIQ